MTTFSETVKAVREVIEKYDYKNIRFLISENKMTENSTDTWYSFRVMVNEPFIGGWRQREDRTYSLMLAVVSA